jgi:hypothetical protein
MNQIVPRYISLFKHLSAATSVMVFLVGLLVLFGWAFDIASIKSAIVRFFQPLGPSVRYCEC